MYELGEPFTYNYDIGSDMFVNGSNIYYFVLDMPVEWGKLNYEAFGKAFGRALNYSFVGQVDTTAEVITYTTPSAVQIAQIVDGVLKGALKAENAEDLLTCLGDTERTVQDLN